MKNKKLLSTAMAVAMAATLMSGCGNKGQDSSTTAATSAFSLELFSLVITRLDRETS